MKLGVISDVHGDPLALERAWSHLAALGADTIVCAGDLVGYGPDPDRTVAFLTEREVPCVRGNHDRWALRRGVGEPDDFGGGTPSAQTLERLGRLPFDRVLSCEGRMVVIVHGSPRSDMEFVERTTHPPRVLDDWRRTLGADLLIVGHTHRPMCYASRFGTVINPGSLISLPVVETSRTFALVALPALESTVYDVETGAPRAVAPWD